MRLGMSAADGLELEAITQDVGQAHEELDAKYEGAELTVAFNPEYLSDGVEAIDRRRGHARDARRAEAGGGPFDRGRTEFLYLLMPVRVS